MENTSIKDTAVDSNTVENDYCDLDETKICDNCYKCLETVSADYVDVHAMFDAGCMLIFDADESDELPEGDLPPMEIDPSLLAEWEEKLCKEAVRERANREGGGEKTLYIKYHTAHMHGHRMHKIER